MTALKITKKSKKITKMKSFENRYTSEIAFLNRDLGWLKFNGRVLIEAQDSRTPILERLRFFSIFSSNLDEFFMKRVGLIKRYIEFNVFSKSADGKPPKEQLRAIRKMVIALRKDQSICYAESIRPELEKNGIYLMKWAELNENEKLKATKYYKAKVFPILTPLSVDPGHPFPFISNLSTSLGVTLKRAKGKDKFFARIKVPQVLPQWIRIESDENKYKFISLIELMRAHVQDLFPQMQVLTVMPFRITRNADPNSEPDAAEDLLEVVEQELKNRRFAEVVRIQVLQDADPWILNFLLEELNLKPEDVYELPVGFDFIDLSVIIDLPLPKLKFEPFQPIIPSPFLEDSTHIFSVIKAADHLVHHPFESFSATVEKFIRIACEDPDVLAIKMTLYRTGDNSPFVRSLIRAAEAGKQVVCLVELKASFDEERNIYWAQALENAGVHVVYGLVGLKTHAKTALVVRQEGSSLRSYAHVGTGNYNIVTSRFYTDLGLLTAREEITEELIEFFNYLTGHSQKTNYNHLLIAPVNMFKKFISMIDREIENAKNKKPAHIIAKFNNMEETEIAVALYRASQAGVKIDLLIRGFTCIKPGVKGISENIRVFSTLGRFLEHSRLFYFRNASEKPEAGEFYLGSADWMYRNLHGRVEAIVPIYDSQLKEKCWEILNMYISDHGQTWTMDAKGNYHQRKSDPEGVQKKLIKLAKERHLNNGEVQ
ncbi:MAG TPA: polyphosphate kinase 1 [Pseudobdellovibrionaceae bacterium]|nr:polyphosphate kinase 1 [Pseudobdellovibrionaceae bacterium]